MYIFFRFDQFAVQTHWSNLKKKKLQIFLLAMESTKLGVTFSTYHPYNTIFLSSFPPFLECLCHPTLWATTYPHPSLSRLYLLTRSALLRQFTKFLHLLLLFVQLLFLLQLQLLLFHSCSCSSTPAPPLLLLHSCSFTPAPPLLLPYFYMFDSLYKKGPDSLPS